MPPKIESSCPLLQVFDMFESLHFYRDLLGFEISQQSPLLDQPYPHINWVWLKRGAAELMLNTAYEADERPKARDPAGVAAHKDTILYFGCPNVDDAYRTLTAAGLKMEPPKLAPYGMKQLYLHDPDGFGICLQWPAEKV